MGLLLVFAVTLVIAVLISGLAEKTVLSVAVLFLASGFLYGSGVFGTGAKINPNSLEPLAEIALFSVLFTDGMKTGGLKQIASYWKLPARALLIGMPLTIAGIAVLARYMTNLDWTSALLIGAALSPTDPVFVSAIFQFEAVPERVKHLLNVESGLNDGLSLTMVVILMAHGSTSGPVLGSLVGMPIGIAIGFLIPWAGIRLEKTRLFHASGLFHPLNAFALGLLVLATSYITKANLFLAAFGAGISIGTFGPSFSESFREFGELVAELLKLAALLVFGAMIAPQFFTALPGREYALIFLAVFAVRIVAVWISMLGSTLTRKESLLTGWFGPKGFASVVYGIFILRAGEVHIARLIALAVAASIVVYSSTDILIGRWFQKHGGQTRPPQVGVGGIPSEQR
jgi:NhaP-type Na+/H+ or K+/H+ antiporter